MGSDEGAHGDEEGDDEDDGVAVAACAGAEVVAGADHRVSVVVVEVDGDGMVLQRMPVDDVSLRERENLQCRRAVVAAVRVEADRKL